MLRAIFGAPFAASLAALPLLVVPSRWREHVGFMASGHPDGRNTHVWFNGVEVTTALASADKFGWHHGPPVHQDHVFERGRLQMFIARGQVRILVGPTPSTLPRKEAERRLRAMFPQAWASTSAVTS